MDFVILAAIFLLAGFLAIWYYREVPTKEELKRRLPNKVSLPSVFLALVIGVVVWYLISTSGGIPGPSRIFMTLFALLLFESFFLFAMRWLQSNFLSILAGLVGSGVIFGSYLLFPSFWLLGVIVILVTFGAATLLIRMDYLRTKVLCAIAILWTAYDIILTEFVLPTFTVPVQTTRPNFLFPSVSVGNISLGSGDFMFLVLFTLILFRDFGKVSAMILVVAQTVGLIITGYFLTSDEFLIPFLAIMTPIFFVVYIISLRQKERVRSGENAPE
ncbi:MAG: hypothetical protein A2898_04395 [Candidatus Kerfeldbacteria bacterium RIFCSPLOWO2_01_FULL_48_11]|uniref:Uncharacterized protein n=1 Tax=Candidatus Kerfeldbacteria bacterium RIFCSPLOWO2_01_FULL_48_11 TaxID=1798543 RepID=A0A1G2B223_9BACT|nr:MAG: hypothetical protein UY34_C0001G0084 [Parcubacteria group bacterium GW2011_GWA2_48_9]KKW16600.1 MAG: hypothetical protein UY52_C0002G0014 [Parcubacteria group bacterium GW2011_GWC2_49_9]OGY82806.1 MAG: hypothetical protein A2898_04395 [Candidatus Kerfeldbacteria bacterium RIFCSPLOWO2_01_FULL_48_11]HCJ52468.1 hypothetical protein [Candidatus Kerfeldbacteria bacterium]HCM68584.1 hypothetical protein [Candidatus Kerfeldbacteria bacterium]